MANKSNVITSNLVKSYQGFLGADMKCAGILPLVILLATSTLGQETASHAEAKILWQARPLLSNPADCPMGLEVKHRPGLPMGMKAEGSSSAPERLVGIHLAMTNLSPRSIVSAQFTVHGYSDKSRYIPLASPSHDADLATVVHVALGVKANGQASRDLELSRFTAITAVDVDGITYADGSGWQASAPGACSASPDLFMAVSAQR
jgi:hypothetical protein